MAGTTKRSLAILGLVIATAGSLNECAKDLGRKLAPNRNFEAHLQQGFGPVSRRILGTNGEGGLRLEVRVTSTKPKSWSEAEMLMSRMAGCGDGRAFTPSWVRPEIPMDKAGEMVTALTKPRPAGTEFVLRLNCEGPLPGAIDFAAGTSVDEVMASVTERIGARTTTTRMASAITRRN